MHYLVCYDITDNKLRKKIADRLFYYGLARAQFSVFIGFVNDRYYKQMKQEMEEKIDNSSNDTDSIIFLRINKTNLGKMIIFGQLKSETNYIMADGYMIYF